MGKFIALLVVALGAASYYFLSSSERDSGPVAGPGESSRPAWVDDPAGYHDPRRGDLVLAVGKAPMIGNPAAARSAAEARMRARLAEMLGVSELRGARVVAQWTSPEQELYVLGEVAAPEED